MSGSQPKNTATESTTRKNAADYCRTLPNSLSRYTLQIPYSRELQDTTARARVRQSAALLRVVDSVVSREWAVDLKLGEPLAYGLVSASEIQST